MRQVIAVVFIFTTIALSGCPGGHAPTLQPLSDQTAVVGVELTFELRATDSDGDHLTFDFNAPSLPDVKKRTDPATLSSFASGVAVFRWTPSAKDMNGKPIAFDFSASDGENVSHETVRITVSSSAGGGPIFREPLGGGTALDLTQAGCTQSNASDCCVQVPVVIDDYSATKVSISDEEPRIPFASIQTTAPFKATWRWCPSDAQKAASQTQYQLLLSADDGASPKVTRSPYLIVLRRASGTGCAGSPPVIMHSPYSSTLMSVQDIEINATITDDTGVKGSPVVYYNDSPPDSPSDIFQWSLKAMTRTGGTALNGTYHVLLPNPIAGSSAGTMDELFYVISATDGDDPTGVCSHTVEAPTSDTFVVALQNSGAVIPLAICTPCSSDAQCGSSSFCAAIVSGSSSSFCSPECEGGCDNAGFHCGSPSNSVNGHLAKYCVPDDGSCNGVSVNACEDDSHEPNDNLSDATPVVVPGTYDNLILCPNDVYALNDDWYSVGVNRGATVTVQMNGVGLWDLDLDLEDTGGNLLAYSIGYTDNEQASATFCAGGTAYIHVYAYPTGSAVSEDRYSLTLSTGPGSCP